MCDIGIPVYWEKKKKAPNGTDSLGLPRCAPYCKINCWSFWRRDLPALSIFHIHRGSDSPLLTLDGFGNHPPCNGSTWKVSGAGLAVSPETPRWVYTFFWMYLVVKGKKSWNRSVEDEGKDRKRYSKFLVRINFKEDHPVSLFFPFQIGNGIRLEKTGFELQVLVNRDVSIFCTPSTIGDVFPRF